MFGLMVFKRVRRPAWEKDESAFTPAQFSVTVGQLMKMFSRQLEMQNPEL